MKRTIELIALVLAASVTIGAFTPLVTVTPQANSPVALLDCALQKQMMPLARGVSVEGFRTGVAFKNTTTKPITQVIFQFTMRDTSGVKIDSHTRKSTGTFAPGVEIDNIHWLNVDSWPTLGEMDCAVDHVVFRDGSTWDPT